MGFFEKIKEGLGKTRKNMTVSVNGIIAAFTGENEEFFEMLEETLILADVGVKTSENTTGKLRELVKERGLRGGEEIKSALIEILTETLTGKERDLCLSTKPAVLLLTGVNGVGKTSTAGKLAAMFKDEGKTVMLCAGDTFRAAAAEQLAVWAQRSGAMMVRHEEGSDPASVIFDGIMSAKAKGVDIIIADTAGRLHNKKNLMDELNKITRVITRELPDADREVLLVLDATTGQNGLIQAQQFAESAGITGIVLTKLDGTAKGGIVFAVADELGIPVKFIGVGEKTEDLIRFEPAVFAEALLS
ncbi:MAG: signal recognition particle-docking protein FtsY [Oscillospiraceae bacterium]|nr:signal recognition particle-docking protein FtsY [Oscillospiraceae bacterium]